MVPTRRTLQRISDIKPSCSPTSKFEKNVKTSDPSFLLSGSCSSHSCPYRHVNVNANASICEGFLKGYYDDGNEEYDEEEDVDGVDPLRIKRSALGDGTIYALYFESVRLDPLQRLNNIHNTY